VGRLRPLRQHYEQTASLLLLSDLLGQSLCVTPLSLWRPAKERRPLSRWMLRSSTRLAQEASPTPILTRVAAQEALPQVCILAEA
jgi:hypothetical protein